MKFKIVSTVYDPADLDDLTLKMILQLEKESEEFGNRITVTDIKTWSDEMAAMKTDTERENHPNATWVLAVGVWAARRLAGEAVTFDQAVDFKMSDLTFLREASDEPRPTQAPPPRKGSGGARKPRPTARPRT